MIRKILLLGCFLFAFIGSAITQELWTLEKSILHAMENSLNVKESNLNIENVKLNSKNALAQRLPNVSGSASYGVSFGRRIDVTTNQFVTNSIRTSSYGLNSGMTLFNGGSIKNNIKQANLDLEASTLDMEQVKNDIGLQVASAYLNILFAEENLQNSNKQLEIVEEQLKQLDRLIEAGTRPRNERLDLLARIAGIEQTNINNENSIITNMLVLKQLLFLEPEDDIRLETPNIDELLIVDPDKISFGEVYAYAVGNQPRFKARNIRKEMAELGVDIAKADLLPSVTFGVGLGTSTSSGNKIKLIDFIPGVSSQPVRIDGVPSIIETDVLNAVTGKKTWLNQIDENLGWGASLNVNIPIYNRGITKNNIDRARLNLQSQDLAEQREQQQLKTDVQNAITSARAAKKQLEASEKSLEALRLAFENAKKRYELGAINSFDFISAQNSMESEEINLLIAKYQYVFRMKVIDFYLGKTITLN